MAVEAAALGRALPAGAAGGGAHVLCGAEMGERVGALAPLGPPQALAAGHRRFLLDVRFRKLADEAAGERAGPLAVDAAVGGVHDGRLAPSPSEGDVGEA